MGSVERALLESKNRKERLREITEAWGLSADNPRVQGVVRRSGNTLYLGEVKNLEGTAVEYPIDGLPDIASVAENGLRVRDETARENVGRWVHAEIDLADEETQRKEENPLLVEVVAIFPAEEGPSRPEAELITVEQAAQLSDPERLNYLLRVWGLDRPKLIGRLRVFHESSEKTLWDIVDPQTPDKEPLSYPLSDLEGGRSRRIFAGTNLPHLEGEVVVADFELSPTRERQKAGNPLLINAVHGSIESLSTIPSSFVVRGDDGEIQVAESLYGTYRQKMTTLLEDELEETRRTLERLKQEADEIREQRDAQDAEVNTLQSTVDDLESTIRGLEEQKNELYQERNRVQKEIEADLAERRRWVEQQKKGLLNEVNQLRAYVKERADRLSQLNLISDRQRADIVGIRPDEAQIDEPALDFEEDLDGRFDTLVAHVQRHLFDTGIIYPRYLLEDFLTLLRTGDLIVLSGLSGSGKTQLVRSFAAAVGGKAHIVPVKPNWTSSDDLLGYYNPLEKSYLGTPFLDALLAAERDPSRLHLICLDEMNLARVEYYFADFLSKLEDRTGTPSLSLYAREEAGHVEAEFRAVMDVIDEASEEGEEPVQRFGDLLRDETVNRVLRQRLGVDSGTSFVELHSRLRRMLSGVLNIPAELVIPDNIRFIGTVNMDQTTHAFAPKVLDRAHVVKFNSPMTYDWEAIENEATPADPPFPIDYPVRLSPAHVALTDYPAYEPGHQIAETLKRWTDSFLRPIGIDIGLRTIRQAQHLDELFRDVHPGEGRIERTLNTVLLQKIFPRFSFEGSRHFFDDSVNDTVSRHDHVERFLQAVAQRFAGVELPGPRADDALERLWRSADASSAEIYNYWM